MPALIEVLISLAFIFFLFSIIVSGICELWQMVMGKRGRSLYKALNDVFNDHLNKDFSFSLLTHPLIDRLRESETKYPAYIAADTFADALVDVVRTDNQHPQYTFNHAQKRYEISQPSFTPAPEKNGQEVLAQYLSATDQLRESDLKQLLRTFAFGARDYDGLKKNIITWFNNYMGATSTHYKKAITRALIIIGAIVTILFNLDAVHLAKKLYADKNLRMNTVAQAIQYATNEQRMDSILKASRATDRAEGENSIETIQNARDQASLLNLPIGWDTGEKRNFFTQMLGWLISIGAISYGANNWFNLLIRFLNIRTAVKPKE
ncbi:MAG TPA: hypothetical protein VI731_05170 [Bacteroidia bacterium]|nr:hypothetical protein [Bacteroidia bacterium]